METETYRRQGVYWVEGFEDKGSVAELWRSVQIHGSRVGVRVGGIGGYRFKIPVV
jgi:hypothetical protein